MTSGSFLWAPKLTEEQRAKLLSLQHGNCPVCSEPLSGHPSQTVVDHCHQTGRVRALMHERCNIRLGYVERLRRGGSRFQSEEVLLQFPTGWVSQCLRFLGVRVPAEAAHYGEPGRAAVFRELMLRTGLTAKEIAHELDLSTRLVSSYCNGRHPPPRAAILALERLVDMQRQVNSRK